MMSPTLVLASFFLSQTSSFSAAFAPAPSLLPSSLATAAAATTTTTTTSSRSTSLSAIREASFGMGCFWEPAESLLKQPGVLATTVGYTGAPPNKKAPTYDSVCFGNDWVEAVRVAYDDELVSYDQLLDYFFQYQKPKLGYRQYASVIFANDANEEQEANKWKTERAASKQTRDDNLPYDIVQIEQSSPFYKAEEYHQRYWEKQRLRFLIGFLLIAGESGAYNKFLGGVEVFGLSFDSVCGAVFLVGAAWMLLERAVARDVKELNQGDLMAMAQLEKN